MKVLTVRQPWASLIVHGIKNIENRTYVTKFRGWLLIHASMANDNIARQVSRDPVYREIERLPHPWHHGAIIGAVEVYDCVKSCDDAISIWGERFCYHWKLRNAIRFREPIVVKGKLGLWNYNGMVPPELQKIIESKK